MTATPTPTTEPSWAEITDAASLAALIGEPQPRVRDKARPALTELGVASLATSPFCVLATSDARGHGDASPKGDPAGQLVHVIDERTIAIDTTMDELDEYCGPGYAEHLS